MQTLLFKKRNTVPHDDNKMRYEDVVPASPNYSHQQGAYNSAHGPQGVFLLKKGYVFKVENGSRIAVETINVQKEAVIKSLNMRKSA